MTWNTRLIRSHGTIGEWVGIYEVHYDAEGTVVAWTAEPCTVAGEDVRGVRRYLKLLEQAFKLPVLEMAELEAMYPEVKS